MKSGPIIGAALALTCCCSLISSAAPIHDAARQGDVGATTRLLEQGVSLETKDATGETPLIAASLAGRGEIVALLIARGANVSARNDRGLTALHAAAYAGSLETIRLLIQAGALVNDAQNKFKVTPLIIAAEQDDLDVEDYLIARGANLEWQEQSGYTALSRAVFRRHSKSVAVLLKAGAKCQSKEIIGIWAAECEKDVNAMQGK